MLRQSQYQVFIHISIFPINLLSTPRTGTIPWSRTPSPSTPSTLVLLISPSRTRKTSTSTHGRETRHEQRHEPQKNEPKKHPRNRQELDHHSRNEDIHPRPDIIRRPQALQFRIQEHRPRPIVHRIDGQHRRREQQHAVDKRREVQLPQLRAALELQGREGEAEDRGGGQEREDGERGGGAGEGDEVCAVGV